LDQARRTLATDGRVRFIDAGHFLMLENPTAVTDAIQDSYTQPREAHTPAHRAHFAQTTSIWPASSSAPDCGHEGARAYAARLALVTREIGERQDVEIRGCGS